VGGGICIHEGSAVISDCIFRKNIAIKYSGGAIYNWCGQMTLDSCVFDGNKARNDGGTIECVSGSCTSTNCVIMNSYARFYGGAIDTAWSDHTLINCTFIANRTRWGNGGGINFAYGNATLINCLFMENKSCENGGGVNNWAEGTLSMTGCTFSRNSSDGYGGGYFCSSEVSANITNSIFWNNDAAEGPEIGVYGSSTLEIGFSDVEGGLACIFTGSSGDIDWGPGMIDADPLFVDSSLGDLHLTYPSPCRDAGDNGAVIESSDFEGDPRIAHGAVDMGADEFYTHLYCTGDKTPGGKIKGKLAGFPATSPVYLILGSGIRQTPLKTQYGDLYLKPKLYFIRLAAMPANGYVIGPIELQDWEARYDLARRETPSQVQAFLPVREGAYRVSGLRRMLFPLLERLQRRESRWWGAEQGGRLAGCARLKARQSTGSFHELQLTLDPPHRAVLGEPLLMLALEELQNYPRQNVVVSTRTAYEDLLAVLKRYGFVEIATSHKLGRRLNVEGGQPAGVTGGGGAPAGQSGAGRAASSSGAAAGSGAGAIPGPGGGSIVGRGG